MTHAISITRCPTRDAKHATGENDNVLYLCRVGPDPSEDVDDSWDTPDEFAVSACNLVVAHAIVMERYGVQSLDDLPHPLRVTPASQVVAGEIDMDDSIPVEIVLDEPSTRPSNVIAMIRAIAWERL